MKLPGFSAEVSLSDNKTMGCKCSDGSFSSSESHVIPQRIATFSGRDAWIAERLCDAVGGGMTSNSDGTVSCHY